MKNLTILFALIFSSIVCFGQGNISPEAKRLLHEADQLNFNLSDKSSLSDEFMNKHKIFPIKGKAYVGGLIKTSKELDEQALDNMKVLIGTKAGNIWTAKIPVDQIKNVSELKGIEYVQLSKPMNKRLNTALVETDVKRVHSGMSLSSAFMGKDVIVGIVDGGFDYTHPAFYDTSMTENRIVRAWNASGKYTTTATIEAQQTDDNSDSHGTHVAGIAAGAGYGDANWNGVAPMSEIVMVSTDIPSTGVNSIVDAIDYIFNYAASQGKPAVVNLSLGSHIGPHDGSSLFDQALNNLVGPGKIVVGAAGNEGSKRLHLSGDLSNTDTAYTFVGNAGYANAEYLDLWGTVGRQFKIQVGLVDTLGGFSVEAQSAFISSDSPTSSHEIVLVDSSNDTCWVDLSTSSSEFNSKPRIFVEHENESSLPLIMAITAKDATASTIHMWNHADGNGAAFYANGWQGILDGNNATSIGEIGGTADSIITVGAYTTKNSYQNIQNTTVSIPAFAALGEIAPFSSLGPTVDNRVKPEISAPGNVVTAAVNSFDANYDANASNVVHSDLHNNKTFYYASLEGTSMATPMVTGIIALWLENYNQLTTYDVKNIFASTSRSDVFTGSSLPNNTWGFGKIDAYDGLVIVGVDEKRDNDYKYSIYPNPAQNRIQIMSEERMQEAQIFSTDGKLIRTIAINNKSKVLDISDLENGSYILRVRKENEVSSRPLIIAR